VLALGKTISTSWTACSIDETASRTCLFVVWMHDQTSTHPRIQREPRLRSEGPNQPSLPPTSAP